VRCPYILSRDPYLSFVVPGIACDGTCTITRAALRTRSWATDLSMAKY